MIENFIWKNLLYQGAIKLSEGNVLANNNLFENVWAEEDGGLSTKNLILLGFLLAFNCRIIIEKNIIINCSSQT